MSRKKVKTDQLAAAIMKELQDYSQDVTKLIKKDVIEVSENTVKRIKMKAPKRTGKYRRGWKYKIMYESESDIRVVIYNSAKPQLAHLLEWGHAGPVIARAFVHIKPGEEYAESELQKKVKVSIKTYG